MVCRAEPSGRARFPSRSGSCRLSNHKRSRKLSGKGTRLSSLCLPLTLSVLARIPSTSGSGTDSDRSRCPPPSSAYLLGHEMRKNFLQQIHNKRPQTAGKTGNCWTSKLLSRKDKPALGPAHNPKVGGSNPPPATNDFRRGPLNKWPFFFGLQLPCIFTLSSPRPILPTASGQKGGKRSPPRVFRLPFSRSKASAYCGRPLGLQACPPAY